MFKYNKGEWSELYVLLSLLDDKILTINESDKYYQILKIYKTLLENLYYDLTKTQITYNLTPLSITKEDLKENISILFNKIIHATESAFSIPELEKFLIDMKIDTIKQANSYKKSDIDLELLTHLGAINFGMSIKSDLGNSPTLLNASQSTNFTYKIINLNYDYEKINQINSRSKVKDRLQLILDNADFLEFYTIDKPTYLNNIKKIDTNLPNILGKILLKFYTSHGVQKIKDLIELIEKIPVEKFLKATALSMIPTRDWNHYENNIGMITVDKLGKITCFDLFNDEAISQYLLENIRFETPSTSRHKFGEIYKENDELYIKLNLQLRFI